MLGIGLLIKENVWYKGASEIVFLMELHKEATPF